MTGAAMTIERNVRDFWVGMGAIGMLGLMALAPAVIFWMGITL
jgi:hypothetical protein